MITVFCGLHCLSLAAGVLNLLFSRIPYHFFEMQSHKRLYRSDRDSVLLGVLGGMAEYFEVDSTVIRVLFIFLAVVTGGLAIIAYFLAALVMPRRPGGDGGGGRADWEESPPRTANGDRPGRLRILAALFLIIVGAAVLLDNFGPRTEWLNRIIWPAVLIILGIAVLISGRRRVGR